MLACITFFQQQNGFFPSFASPINFCTIMYLPLQREATVGTSIPLNIQSCDYIFLPFSELEYKQPLFCPVRQALNNKTACRHVQVPFSYVVDLPFLECLISQLQSHSMKGSFGWLYTLVHVIIPFPHSFPLQLNSHPTAFFGCKNKANIVLRIFSNCFFRAVVTNIVWLSVFSCC